MNDSQVRRGDARELLLYEEPHVALKLLELKFVILVQIDLPRNLSPDFILDVVLVAGALIKGLADLGLADSSAMVGVHCVECLLQVFLLEQALAVKCCLAEFFEFNLAALISVNLFEDLLELFLFKVVQTWHFLH